ncbi:amblin-like [Dermacentor variabilis]|uniref:amblin-like n=1 Tax=Dermacentor variabilis TaxID=34621 RepID=UPI003F5B3ABD
MSFLFSCFIFIIYVVLVSGPDTRTNAPKTKTRRIQEIWRRIQQKPRTNHSNSESRPARCTMPPEAGNCRAHIPTWYFDPTISRCRMFIYGGCGGNENQFSSEKKCQKVCLQSWERMRVCSPKPKRGLCNNDATFWYFDPAAPTCHRYKRGLCEQGANKFQSCDKCMAMCTNMDFRQRCRLIMNSEPGPGGPE